MRSGPARSCTHVFIAICNISTVWHRFFCTALSCTSSESFVDAIIILLPDLLGSHTPAPVCPGSVYARPSMNAESNFAIPYSVAAYASSPSLSASATRLGLRCPACSVAVSSGVARDRESRRRARAHFVILVRAWTDNRIHFKIIAFYFPGYQVHVMQ
eukprot:COSAG02_NODE_4741_length_5035_cov_2.309562_5_plen_158_part_00